MPSRNVAFTERQASMIDQLVKAGTYDNCSEVVHEALSLLEIVNSNRTAKLAVLRAAVQVGLHDLEAGNYRDFRTEEELRDYFDQLENRVLGSSLDR